MRKKLAKLLTCTLALGMLAAVPAYAEQNDFAYDQAVDAIDSEHDYSYVMNYFGVEIRPGHNAAPVLVALTPYLLSATPDATAAAEGEIRTNYLYPGMEISTVTDEGVEFLDCIHMDNALVPTPEGIRVSNTSQDVFAVYGTDYREDVKGFYRYMKGNTELTFICDANGVVSAIDYAPIDWLDD